MTRDGFFRAHTAMVGRVKTAPKFPVRILTTPNTRSKIIHMSNESRILANRLAFLSDNLGNAGEECVDNLCALFTEDGEESLSRQAWNFNTRIGYTTREDFTEEMQDWVQKSQDFYWDDQAILSITGIHD